jgi:predicted transcriptional regulator
MTTVVVHSPRRILVMAAPRGNLTAAQYEIMSAVWNAGDEGISVADIWQTIAQARAIGRTTVLNQVDRLGKRGWLVRVGGNGPTRFRAALAKQDASRQLVADFVSDYFQGSAVDLVSALLGGDVFSLTKKDIGRLRKMLEEARQRQAEEPR